VTEVEDRATAGVTLVGRDDLELRPCAVEDHVGEGAGVEWIDLLRPLPQAAAGDQARLQNLDVAGGELFPREGLERARVGKDRERLVVCADVVLRRGKIDAGLPSVRGVDHRHQRRR
jgi:hypothetical protein